MQCVQSNIYKQHVAKRPKEYRWSPIKWTFDMISRKTEECVFPQWKGGDENWWWRILIIRTAIVQVDGVRESKVLMTSGIPRVPTIKEPIRAKLPREIYTSCQQSKLSVFFHYFFFLPLSFDKEKIIVIIEKLVV